MAKNCPPGSCANTAGIVLAADGAHLIDMGIARMMSDSVPPQGARMGTRGYASPEQCFAAADARFLIDIEHDCESLNVGAAAAVCLFEQRRRRLLASH